jgi:hypothetical protein
MIPTPERPEAGKVTLEELLRLKRAERPAPEFWGRFEQDLRAKQLAAIVEPRPWWITLRLPQIARSLSRYQLPVGAAAVLALSFVAVREYRPGLAPASQVLIEESAAPFSNGNVGSKPEFVPEVARVESTSEPVAAESTLLAKVELAEASAPRLASLEAMPVGPGELLSMIPWAAPQTAQAEPMAKPVTLGELPKAHFASAIKPAGEHRFEDTVEAVSVNVATAAPAREPADDLIVAPMQASPVSPREVRSNRILSSLVVADNIDADRSRMAQVREVLTSSLDNDQLYDSVRRLGMGGDRLTLKF